MLNAIGGLEGDGGGVKQEEDGRRGEGEERTNTRRERDTHTHTKRELCVHVCVREGEVQITSLNIYHKY